MKPPIRRVGDNVIVCKAQLSAQQGRRQSFAQSVIAAATLNEDGDYVLPHDKMLALMRVKVTTNPKPKRAQDATIAAREAICKGCSFWEPAGFGKMHEMHHVQRPGASGPRLQQVPSSVAEVGAGVDWRGRRMSNVKETPSIPKESELVSVVVPRRDVLAVIQFLNRSRLEGHEVPTFVNVMGPLHRAAQGPAAQIEVKSPA
ncbi:hypothetical protein SAMN05444156_3271 [Verrucomicrobium sp. GAS474]|nr:hypothetical protein SAMN05444156_3271 [Verrucomicrobium sp. GAS474]